MAPGLVKVEKTLFVLKFLDMNYVVKMAILCELIHLVKVDSRHLFRACVRSLNLRVQSV